MKRLRPGFVTVLAFAVAGLATDGAAAEAASQGPSAPEEVEVYLVGPVHTRALEELLREWFASEGEPVSIAARRSVVPNQVLEATDGPPLRAWVLLHHGDDVRIIFADAERRRFFVRDVPLDNGLDEVGREKLAQVLLASSQAFAAHRVEETPLEQVEQALSEPEAQGQPRDASAPALPPKPAPESAPRSVALESPKAPQEEGAEASRLSWAVSAGYTATYRGPAGFAHGPAATLEAWFDLDTWAFGLAGGGRYEFPHIETGEQVELSVQNTALRLGVLFASIGEHRPVWMVSLGIGWDWVGFRPIQGDEGVLLHSSDTTQRPVGTVGFGRFVQLGWLRLGASLAAEFAFEKLHYDVIDGQQQSRTLTPWQAYPHAAFSLGWH